MNDTIYFYSTHIMSYYREDIVNYIKCNLPFIEDLESNVGAIYDMDDLFNWCNENGYKVNELYIHFGLDLSLFIKR